jgi:hypothetical protein
MTQSHLARGDARIWVHSPILRTLRRIGVCMRHGPLHCSSMKAFCDFHPAQLAQDRTCLRHGPWRSREPSPPQVEAFSGVGLDTTKRQQKTRKVSVPVDQKGAGTAVAKALPTACAIPPLVVAVGTSPTCSWPTSAPFNPLRAVARRSASAPGSSRGPAWQTRRASGEPLEQSAPPGAAACRWPLT